MTYFIGKYSNGYCGCDEIVFLIADSYDEADAFMEANLDNYGYEYEYCADVDEDDEESEDNYWENVTYSLREATPEEVEKEDADEWIVVNKE